MRRTIDIELTYQPTIEGPPVTVDNLTQQAVQADDITVNSWRETWIKNYTFAKEHFGTLADHSIGKLYGANMHKPCIILGSGPSLKHQVNALKENATFKNRIMTISALHNFSYFEDEKCHADYYVTVDAGDIVLTDVTEGGKEKEEEYWKKTEGHTLLAYACSPPKLLEKWKGQIYLFNILCPDRGLLDIFHGIERFDHYISCGGNVGGALQYIARAVFGSSNILVCGIDCCFDYDHKFYPWNAKMDCFNGNGKMGNVVYHPDVFGNLRATYPSYFRFKCYFDKVVCTVPGIWFNCSEGILGAYREGNISQYRYMSLSDALIPYQMVERVFLATHDKGDGKELSRQPILLEEIFKNAQNKCEVVLF